MPRASPLQIDLWHKRGLGQLAADFGPAFAEDDRASHCFCFAATCAEWIAYSSDTKRIVKASWLGWCAIALTREQPALLPPEFDLLGCKPALWSTVDVVRIRSRARAQHPVEVARSQTVALAGLEVDAIRRPLDPPWQTACPTDSIPHPSPPTCWGGTLAARRLSSSRNSRASCPRTGLNDPSRLIVESNRVFGRQQLRRRPGPLDDGPAISRTTRTASGLPSLRYFAHLRSRARGHHAGEPFLPGVSLGHNRHVAFGITIFAIDQEDLYV
jgi:penicillin amidase